MRKFIYIGVSNLLALYLVGMIFPSIKWDSFLSLLAAATLLTVFNWMLRPIVMLVALPINLITIGLFVLIINTWMVMLTDCLIKGWQIQGFWLAFITGIVVALCNKFAKSLYRQSRGRFC